MKLVTSLEHEPAKCVVTGDIEGPFVDFECWSPQVDPRIALHAPVIKQAARELLGMVEAEEVEALKKQLSDYALRVEEAEALLAKYSALAEAERELEEAVA